MNTSTSPLDNIRIASPCSADWDAMSGNDRVRFCGQCNLNVYDLSAMRRPDAERLVRESEGHLCVRFHKRHDGTLITEDCPVGIRAVQARMVRRLRSMAAAALTLVAGVAGLQTTGWAQSSKMGRAIRTMQGEPDVRTASDSVAAADTLVQIELPEDMTHVVMGGLMAPQEIEQIDEPVDEAPGDDSVAVDEATIGVDTAAQSDDYELGEISMKEVMEIRRRAEGFTDALEPDETVPIGPMGCGMRMMLTAEPGTGGDTQRTDEPRADNDNASDNSPSDSTTCAEPQIVDDPDAVLR